MGNNWLDLTHMLKNDFGSENNSLLKEKEIYNKIVAERKMK